MCGNIPKKGVVWAGSEIAIKPPFFPPPPRQHLCLLLREMRTDDKSAGEMTGGVGGDPPFSPSFWRLSGYIDAAGLARSNDMRREGEGEGKGEGEEKLQQCALCSSLGGRGRGEEKGTYWTWELREQRREEGRG